MSDDHGRFIWYELMTQDVEAAKRFYGDLIGWTYEAMPGDPPYTIVKAGESGMGGMMTMPAEVKSMGVPPNWAAYVAVEDCDAAFEKIKRLGGSTRCNPMDIPGVGRFAVVADPDGAVFMIMTPQPPEPGQDCAPPPQGTHGQTSWHELYGGDPDTAFAFYSEMFGWKKDEAMDMGPMGTYQLFANQQGVVGGMMKKPPQVPQSCWLYYFQVGDIDEAVERVLRGGGTVINGPMEVPGGDWILQGIDPQGAMFALSGRRA